MQKPLSSLLQWVRGNRSRPIERQFHSLVLFFGGALSTITVLANWLLGLVDEMMVFSLVLVTSSFVVWHLNRFTNLSMAYLRAITVGVSFVIVTYAWFIFGGSIGMTPPMLFWMAALALLYQNQKAQWFVLSLVILLLLSLFLTEFLQPTWINPYYSSPSQRILDVCVSYCLCVVGFGVLILILSKNYHEIQSRYATEQLVRVEEEAKAREEHLRLLSRLSQGLAHDLNNVLVVILSRAEFVQSDLGTSDVSQETQEDLKAIQDSALVASRLTRRLFDQSLHYEEPPKSLSLSAVLKEQARLIDRLSEQVSVKLEIKSEVKIVAHLIEVEQVLMNLALNGLQAMEGLGDLTLRLDQDADWAILEVSDQGQGIPPEIQDNIFQPLFTTKSHEGGTGIGLSTVHNIIQRMGGTIQFDTILGQGTCFKVRLPLNTHSLNIKSSSVA